MEYTNRSDSVPEAQPNIIKKLIMSNAGWRQDMATDNQKYFLMSHSKWKDGMRKGEASDLISRIKNAQKTMSKEQYESYCACEMVAHLQPSANKSDNP